MVPPMSLYFSLQLEHWIVPLTAFATRACGLFSSLKLQSKTKLPALSQKSCTFGELFFSQRLSTHPWCSEASFTEAVKFVFLTDLIGCLRMNAYMHDENI